MSKIQINEQKHFKNIPLIEETKQNAFDTLTVDLCGLWPFVATIQEQKEMGKNKQGKEKKIKIVEKEERVKIWALTMMDEVTSWIEIMPIDNKKSEDIALLVDLEWFNRYPRPIKCILMEPSSRERSFRNYYGATE